LKRGYNHQSPYYQPDLTLYKKEEIDVKVNLEESKKELQKRCPECREKINNLN
jgi:formylmethanofuran dehydrogenase subunit E